MGNHYLKWTPDAVLIEAERYRHVIDFRRNARGAYNAAKKYGIYRQATEHMVRAPTVKSQWCVKWTEAHVREVALTFSSRVDFQEKCRGGYQAARKMGIVDDVCAHMVRRGQKWFPATIAAEAKRYTNRLAFHVGSQGACQAARNLGIFDQVCSHMVENLITDNNVVYIWKAKGSDTEFGDAIYKIGTTSERLKDKRIRECSASFELEAEIIVMSFVGFRATLIEGFLLGIFERTPTFPNHAGYSEFRILNQIEISQAVTIAEAFAFLSHP